VQRALKLARYLPNAGWRAHLLTSGHQHYPVLDPTLCGEVDNATSIHRVLGLEPGAIARRIAGCLNVDNPEVTPFENRLYWRLDRWLSRLPLAETELLWLPAAFRRARRMVREDGIEAIITTSPPCTTHMIGWWLHRHSSIPWIADLRDPITDNFAYRPRSALDDRFYCWLERIVVQSANRVVVTSPELADRLRRRFPEIPPGRFVTIMNGYDAADAPTAQKTPGQYCTLTHVGSFYRDQTIEPILHAVRQLRAARPDISDCLRLRLVGTVASSQQSLLQAEDKAFVTHIGYVDHRSAINEMADADALILTTPSVPGGELCIPAKTFEYLAFGPHIIAFLHDDTQIASVLRRAGNCTLIHQAGAAAWAGAMESCFDAWKARRLQQPRDYSVVDTFRRDRLAVRFARVVDECVASAEQVSVIRKGLAQESMA
jgi:hypothetical protein